MIPLTRYLIGSILWMAVMCSPYDDGKYNPKKYKIFDDGKYYRPLDEGKYIPGDEGRYTYVYRQGLYPGDDGDYRYIHVVGPNGGFGGQGGFGGEGSGDGFGPNGPNGPYGPDGSPGFRKPNIIEYIGKRIYAERYPYVHKVIKALIDEYESEEFMTPEGSANYYRTVYAGKGVAAKCQYLVQEPKNNETEFITEYPPFMEIKEPEKLGSFYTFKGTRMLNESCSSCKKLKLEYETFVRVTEVTDGNSFSNDDYYQT